MRRRKFIGLVGAVVSWPLAVRAQQPAMPVIGYLGPTSPHTYMHIMAAFHQGLKEAGYVEGQIVVIEYRWAPAIPYTKFVAYAHSRFWHSFPVRCDAAI